MNRRVTDGKRIFHPVYGIFYWLLIIYFLSTAHVGFCLLSNLLNLNEFLLIINWCDIFSFSSSRFDSARPAKYFMFSNPDSDLSEIFCCRSLSPLHTIMEHHSMPVFWTLMLRVVHVAPGSAIVHQHSLSTNTIHYSSNYHSKFTIHS